MAGVGSGGGGADEVGGGGGGGHETTNMPVKKENKEDGWIDLIVKAVALAAQCF